MLDTNGELYERPDERTEPVVDVGPGQTVVVDEALFGGREGLCRTGRLVAMGPDGAELDQLYTVCKGRVWKVERSTSGPD